MRTVELNLYTYDELSEEAQVRALDKLRDINVCHDWWDYIYEDARLIGLKLEGFNDRLAEGKLTETVGEVCRRIVKTHGKGTNTYHVAMWYFNQKHEGKPITEEEFLKALLDVYHVILNDSYEAEVSDEAVAETIRINEYEFTEDGSMY